ncbi:MAG: serine hydrolase domain-containing protein [Metallibacterium sp.]
METLMDDSIHTAAEPSLVLLPDASSPSALPKGWTSAEGMRALTLVGPERDLQIAFVATAKVGESHAIAAAAWRLLDPTFDSIIARQVEQPSTSGWDLATEIFYRTPTTERRVVLAFVRTLRDRAYVNLISGTVAAFSRREAQIAELIEAWRPEGLAAVSLTGHTAAIWSSQQSAQLGRFIRGGMATLRIPGVSIAIVQRGSVAYAEGFGFCTAGSTQPVTPDTRFMIGSTTKSLTTLMMARLVEQGHFSWTTPVTELLPDFALGDADMTRRLEMQHTVAACTGMPRRDIDLVFKFKGISPEQRLAEMKAMWPTTGFGEIFQYSNYLVAAGGYAAARSYVRDGPLGSAYEQAMQQLVFDPLGMTNSTLRQEVACTNNAASPHAIDFDGSVALVDPNMERFVDAVAPAGAVWSTVLDIAQYLLLELNGGNAKSGKPLVSTALLEGRRRGGIKIDGKTSYGLGLLCADEQGLEVIGHGGGTSGFTSDMYFLPAQDLGVVVLTNLRLANTFLAAVRQKILEMLFDARPTSDQMIAGAAKAQDGATKSLQSRVQIDPDSVAWLDGQVGHYYCGELGNAEITRRDGKYCMQFEAWGSALGSETQSDGHQFAVLISPPWIGLRLQVAGEGSELHLDGGQAKYVFKKR